MRQPSIRTRVEEALKAVIPLDEKFAIIKRQQFDHNCEIIGNKLSTLDEYVDDPRIARAVIDLQIAYTNLEVAIENADTEAQKTDLTFENP